MNEQTIFFAAMEIADLGQRADYLDQACVGKPVLRKQVDALFAAHERSGEFLDVPALKQMAADASESDGSEMAVTSVGDQDVGEELDLSFLQPSAAPGSIGRLGHYEIQDVIGRGGCGIVLKAFDEKLERIVAIKIMARELAATSPARKRFLREARATAAIRHENVVSIHAVEEQPLPFLVMEYIDGQTLQQKLDQNGPLDIQDVLRIGYQIASGLGAAHAKGLIHRDIKPANILLEDGADHVKITDFGLARSADDASMTQSGVVSGTPLYMSPEQAQAQDIDQRSDLFSLGSVLYVMCSGRPPFRAASTLAVMKRVVEEQPRPIQRIISEVPGWLVAIITILHAKDPQKRFASAQEVGDLLAQCLAELEQHGRVELSEDILAMIPQPTSEVQELVLGTHSTSADEAAVTAASRPARSRNWAAAAAMILVLLTGLGLTEATGVTNVRGTIIRLFSPDGTLVVEVDDPGVSVTIDGEEMVITGTGAKEIRLKPGQYKLLASKDGRVVRQELVTVTTNGRQVVRVSKESLPMTEPATNEPSDVAMLPPWRPTSKQQQFLASVAMMTPENQIQAVTERLKEVNPPHYQITVEHTLHQGYVNHVRISSPPLADYKGPVLDFWPLTALAELRSLDAGTWITPQTDLVPLATLPLEELSGVAITPFHERAPLLVRTFPHLNSINGATPERWLAREAEIEKLRQRLLALSPQEQLARVVEKLIEYNPGFDGTLALKTITAEGVEGIEIRNGRLLVDLSPLRALAELEHLNCSVTGVADLSPLAELSLTSLDCTRTRVSDLTPLNGMLLTSLSCTNTRVSDLSPLEGMPLTALNCSGTLVSDLAPLKGMPLTGLSCRGIRVSDLSPLKGAPLTRLACDGTRVTDLAPLEGMPLTSLECNSTGVSDLSPLKGMLLTSLHCEYTRVSDLTPLNGMPLTYLNCERTLVADLAPLKGVPLTSLNCKATRVSDLSPLEGMPLGEIVVDVPVNDDQFDAVLKSLPLKKINGKPVEAF